MFSAPLSLDDYRLLATLQLQRVASIRLLQAQLPNCADIEGLLVLLQGQGLVRLRGEQLWCLTPEGTLALILGVRQGHCPAPDWSSVASVTGHELTHSLVRELCLGEHGEIPSLFNGNELLALLDTADAFQLLRGASESWQMLLLEYFALQLLLETPPAGPWPLVPYLHHCTGAAQKLANDLASEWQWLCGEKGTVNSAAQLNDWPALTDLLHHPLQRPLSEALLSALAHWRESEQTSAWPNRFSTLLWLGWLQQSDPLTASEHRKKWHKFLAGRQPLLTDVLAHWAGDRQQQAVGLFDTLQLPISELPWGYLWLDLCALARHGMQSPQVAMLHKWDLFELLDTPAEHRLMAFCQDLLRLLMGEPLQHAPLISLQQSSRDSEDAAALAGDEAAGSANWLNWLQGLGRTSSGQKPRERVVWLLHADGPWLECKIQKLNPRGEWSAGRRLDPSVLASQYAQLLDEHDWTLLRALGRSVSALPKEAWPMLAHHPRLLNQKGDRLQLAISAPLLYIHSKPQGMTASLNPASASKGVSIEPLSQDLWQVILTPKALLDKLPALQHIPTLNASQLSELGHTLNAITGLPWYSQVAGLEGNAMLEPWPGQAGISLNWQQGQLLVQLMTFHEGIAPLPLGKGEAMVRQAGKGYHFWQRDLAGEKQQAFTLCQILPMASHCQQWQLEGEAALALVSALPSLVQDGVAIYWQPESARLKSLNEESLTLRIERRQDWFQVDGALNLDEQQVLDLRLVLRQMKPGVRTVQLDEKTSIILSDTLSDRLNMLSAMLDDELRISEKLAYPLTRLLNVINTQGDEAWQALQQEWQQEVACPPEYLAPLRDYQKAGVRWLASLAHHGFGACLADDMGLGKTLQALMVLRMRQHLGPALVVVPKSVVTNWQEEAARFAPELSVVVIDVPQERDRLINSAKAGSVVLINYGLVASLAHVLGGRSWSSIVLDEAQQIKNAGTKRAKLLFQLEGDFRLALSGTPIENHLGELWSLFTFINPGLLGSLSEFKRRFGKAVKDPKHMALLRALISPFILRRLKQHVLAELPDKTEIVHHVSLSAPERELYEATRREVVQQVQSADGRALMHVLSGLTRLRRLCCSPALILPQWQQANSKLDEAMALIEEAIEGGHRILVFSQFVDLLSLLRQRIAQKQWDYSYLDGSCSVKERQAAILRFRNEPVSLFLISLKAGGTGLNLTQADTVIHLDPWWNPAVEDQASDRAHRMGQTQPVTVYRLVCEQTVEEKIVALHEEKRALADGLLSGQSEVGRLDLESLRDLLLA